MRVVRRSARARRLQHELTLGGRFRNTPDAPLSGQVRAWHVLVLATCLDIVNAFDIPAWQSFVVEMVGREGLTNAIALNSSMVNGARVVGPAVAGCWPRRSAKARPAAIRRPR